MRSRLDVIALVVGLLVASCGEDASTVPPASLVGTWNATSAELVRVANPDVLVDLIVDLGAAVTLLLEEDDDFALTVTYTGQEPGGAWGFNTVITGTWSATDVLTLRASATSQWQFGIDLNGDTLVLTNADTSFDFDGDGIVEDADFNLELTQS